MRARNEDRVVWLAALLGVSSCTAASSSEEVACPTGKLGFTRANVCQTDGYVEFCVPRDPVVEARVRAIAPDVETNGGSGRASCDLETQTLHLLPLESCLEADRAVDARTWTTICELASLPEIPRIVRTRFE